MIGSWRRQWFGPAEDGAPALAAKAAPASTPVSHEPVPVVAPADPIDAAFWILLLRAPDGRERADRRRALDAGQPFEAFIDSVMASPEFRLVFEAQAGRGDRIGRKPAAVDAGLAALGSNSEFVSQAFQCLLGRDVDESGRQYWASRLDDGASRQQVLAGLVQSEEFERRFREACPDIGVLPRDVQLCELANPAKWDNPEWTSLLASLETMPVDKMSMHRKGYEFAQLLFGLTRLGRLAPDARVLSVGAGHEAPLYWLANRVRLVVATDMYDESWRDAWAGEGDARVLARPSDYSPFPYREAGLVFVKMDGRRLAFPAAAFDIVYSLSSIEHFGGLAGATEAMDDMTRVLKPGGLLVLATEYCLSGPPHHEAFQPGEVAQLLTRPALRMIEPLDERVHARYEMAAVDIRRNPYQTPHMAVRDGDTVFTSVVAFLERVNGAR
jgi:SAM-dependent methyltransferase